ncbi:MAG: hypothetical protein GY913_10475 [Proteobacteria bacterium]|nr:hypothetical protein [Pseudomonadota bacterium]MCP4917338.1 hypothetical protein [Pseudomonadota bacterium]
MTDTELQRFIRSFRAFAEHHGAGAKYHETITWFWFLLIHERIQRTPTLDWPAFVAAHPDLFQAAVIDGYYDAETLGSEQARATFVLPRGMRSPH